MASFVHRVTDEQSLPYLQRT